MARWRVLPRKRNTLGYVGISGRGEGVSELGRTEEWKGFDLDGGYHNRLFYYFTPLPRLVFAPRVSHRGSGGASREGPDQMTSLPYGI